jgi:quercetin dioxygenase-like cupin family protein
MAALILLCTSLYAADVKLNATDVTAADIQKTLQSLPPDELSDVPLRVVDVGGHNMGVYLVYRKKGSPQAAVVHDSKTSETYYMLEGAGTLVTGGTLVNPKLRDWGAVPTSAGPRIEGGTSRRIAKGDVVIVPPGVAHWWSASESDLTYLVIRADPAKELALK